MDSDFHTMCEWYHRRRIPPPPEFVLPPQGLIVDATACGFLVETNSKLAILDFFCSNPLSPKEDRLEAIYDIAHVLVMTAKRMGFKAVKCDTKYDNIKRMATKQGFDYLGDYSSYFKELF